jgi:hypothetical protein
MERRAGAVPVTAVNPAVRTGSPGGAIATRSGDSRGLQALQRTGSSHLRYVDVLARVGRLYDLKLGNMHNIPFGVPEPMVTRSAMAAPNGGSARGY